MEDIFTELEKLNKVTSNVTGWISGANIRIGVMEKELNDARKELGELRCFKETVTNDYTNYKGAMSAKKKSINSISSIKNMRCANEYYKNMHGRLTGKAPDSVTNMFEGMITAIEIKINALQTKETTLNGAIRAERIKIGDWTTEIRAAKNKIKKLEAEAKK